MSDIVNTLEELNVADDNYVYLNYVDRASVWHISDDHVETALQETSTADILAGALATPGVTVLSRYDEDVLANIRDNGLLDDYDRDGDFEDYLADVIRQEAYELDLLSISVERHDHKRGTCEVASNIKVTVADLRALDDADVFTSGWEVAIQTAAGTLTLK
tara:strand:+ start:10733 stop:11215 length:483 start_codon:yes stop_codon:yes gene_type:complete